MTDVPRFVVGCVAPPMHASFDQAVDAAPQLRVERVLHRERPHDEVHAMLQRCHGYYSSASRAELPRQFQASAELLARLPRLLVVVSYGAGYDTVDVDACTAAGVAVVCQAGGNAEGVAEHALGMILALLKRIPQAQAAMRAGTVGRREAFLGRELVNRTVGIVGLGHIGTRVAKYAAAFDCRVLACDPYLDAATCRARGAQKVALDALLAQADVVTVHAPLTDETRNLFDAARFAAMRPGAIFVNTARGTIHDESALHAALVAGHVGGAGLDVWDAEPPPVDHPLLAHPAVLSSVHTAGVTHESRERVGRMAGEAFIAAAAGEVPPRLVNPEVLDRYRARWSEAFGSAFPGR